MAEQLEQFPSTRTRYPWEEWEDGSVWKITQGADFECHVMGMRMQIYNRAKTQGLKVRSTIVENNSIVFQFRDADEAA